MFFRPNKKRQFKNQKYGFGGQKKRGKMNSRDSSADLSGFNHRVNQSKPGKLLVNKNKKKVTYSCRHGGTLYGILHSFVI